MTVQDKDDYDLIPWLLRNETSWFNSVLISPSIPLISTFAPSPMLQVLPSDLDQILSYITTKKWISHKNYRFSKFCIKTSGRYNCSAWYEEIAHWIIIKKNNGSLILV